MSEKWYETGDDWGESNEPWVEIDNFAKAILDKINILDILDIYEIDYFKISAGNFTHKLRCPFPNHLDGQERTASLCVSEKNNDFHCYGCQSNGNVIDFTMLLLGVPYYKSLDILAKIGNISGDNLDVELLKPKEKVDPNHTIMPYIFQTGVLIREFLSALYGQDDYKKWSIWSDKQFKKLDYYLDTLEDEQWETVKKYYNKVSKYLELKRKK